MMKIYNSMYEELNKYSFYINYAEKDDSIKDFHIITESIDDNILDTVNRLTVKIVGAILHSKKSEEGSFIYSMAGFFAQTGRMPETDDRLVILHDGTYFTIHDGYMRAHINIKYG